MQRKSTKKSAQQKLTLGQMVAAADDAKKVNALDLSADQDLSIALMNLIALEEHFFFSGAKTNKTDFYDMVNAVREMRKELMGRIVQKSTGENDGVWCVSKHLLAASMRLIEVGTKALGAGNKTDAYAMLDKAYELYSLFWGINMNIIDLSGVQVAVPDFYTSVADACRLKTDEIHVDVGNKSKSVVRRMTDWVKDKVNCCIE